MKARPYSDSSFFAKMVLLFALVFMGHPQKRKGLETFVKNFFLRDSISAVGQVPAAKIATSRVLPATLPH